MSYVKDALLGASPYKKQQEESKHLVSKWDKTGLLDGLNEDFEKSGMAVLLENQARQLVNEVTVTNPSGASGDEEWSGVALPLVRRIFGEIAAQDFVSVQPMNLPSGLVFYLDFQYGKTHGGFTKGTSIHGKTGPNSPLGSEAPYGDENYAGGFYGAGKFDYSSNEVTTSAITSAGALAAANFTTASLGETAAAWNSALNYDSDLSASLASKSANLHKLTFSTASFTRLDTKGVRSINIVSSSANFHSVIQQLTSINDAETEVTLIVSGGADIADSAKAFGVKLSYSQQPTDVIRGDFEDRVGSASDGVDLGIPQVDLQLKSQAIVAKTRKLKAVWTPELAQDLNAYHSVDAEAELTSMLSEYISMEIDLEILDMLIQDATTTEYWSARQGYDYSTATGGFVNNGFTGTRFEWWQTLLAKVQKLSNEIHRLTLRGGANFLVCSPKVATILESLPGYMSQTDGNKAQFAMGVQSIGSIQNRWTVYKNPYMTENTILVGFRGANFLETGAVYAPYVPLIMTPLVYDPEDFTPRKGVMTRYAKKMIRPEFYGKIYAADLDIL